MDGPFYVENIALDEARNSPPERREEILIAGGWHRMGDSAALDSEDDSSFLRRAGIDYPGNKRTEIR